MYLFEGYQPEEGAEIDLRPLDVERLRASVGETGTLNDLVFVICPLCSGALLEETVLGTGTTSAVLGVPDAECNSIRDAAPEIFDFIVRTYYARRYIDTSLRTT